jgi:Hemolysin activation/secretion protein
VSVGELQQFTERLTRRYQRDGYLLSLAYLPDQDFAEGRVHVVLVEGYVHDVRREGEIGPAGAYLDQLLERLRAERPLTQATLDRFIGLAQRIPGVTLQADLTPAEHRRGRRAAYRACLAQALRCGSDVQRWQPRWPAGTLQGNQQCPDPFCRAVDGQRAAATG